MLDYEAFRAEQARAREAGRYLGVGFSNYVEPTTPAFGIFGTEGATIRIEPTGKVNVYVAGGSSGNSLETTVVQLTADALGVDIDDVNTIQGDTALTGFGAGTGGSRSGAMLAGAIGETAGGSARPDRGDRRPPLRGRGRRTSRSPTGGRTCAARPTRGSPSPRSPALAYFSPASLPPDVPPGLEASGRFAPSARSNWANATHVCTCEVDVATGQVALLRYIVSEDCGAMINPNVVEGQIAGGTVQGIGGALLEQIAYDEDGNPLATTFVDYLLPTATEVPEIEYGHLETPGPLPGGYKGVGEGGAIGAPPAVVNAVNDALAPLGVTLTRLPLSPASRPRAGRRVGVTRRSSGNAQRPRRRPRSIAIEKAALELFQARGFEETRSRTSPPPPGSPAGPSSATSGRRTTSCSRTSSHCSRSSRSGSLSLPDDRPMLEVIADGGDALQPGAQRRARRAPRADGAHPAHAGPARQRLPPQRGVARGRVALRGATDRRLARELGPQLVGHDRARRGQRRLRGVAARRVERPRRAHPPRLRDGPHAARPRQ